MFRADFIDAVVDSSGWHSESQSQHEQLVQDRGPEQEKFGTPAKLGGTLLFVSFTAEHGDALDSQPMVVRGVHHVHQKRGGEIFGLSPFEQERDARWLADDRVRFGEREGFGEIGE